MKGGRTDFYDGGKMKRIISCVLLVVIMVYSLSIPILSIATDNVDDLDISLPKTDEVLSQIDCVNRNDDSYYSHYLAPTQDILLNNYPSSVDLSMSPYFPDHSIVQGNIESCVAFSSVYYQFNYEVNRALNQPASNADPYSPTWCYYWCNSNNANEGVEPHAVYDFLATHGCFHLSDDPYSGVFNNDYQLPTILDEDLLLEALKTRIADYGVLTIPTGSSSILLPTDSSLNQIKYYLNQGFVLRAGTSWAFDYDNIGNTASPELVLYRFCASTGGHSFVVVGYDDEFEYDVNGDEFIEDSEKGAFKIINTYDMGPECVGPSSGPAFEAWVLYDALNLTSNISGSWENNLAGIRCPAFEDLCDSYQNTNVFNFITGINHYDGIYYISRIEILSPANQDYWAEDIYKVTTSNTIVGKGLISIPERSNEYYVIYQDYNDSYSEYANSNPNSIFSSISVSMPGDLTGFKWGFYMNNGTAFRKVIVDDLGNTIKSMSSANTVSGKVCYEATIDLQKGDLNYDGSLSNSDVTKLSQFIVGSTDPSTLQKYLSDMNDDGAINSKDLIRLMALI